jgi:hypothetical protein
LPVGFSSQFGHQMPLTPILIDFDRLRKLRKAEPLPSLELVGQIAQRVLSVLLENCDRHSLGWRGRGTKEYEAFTLRGTTIPFSRGINVGLFIHDEKMFGDLWKRYLEALAQARGSGSPVLGGLASPDINRLVYTAVVGYGAATDLFGAGNRGGPGTFFEMVIGPSIAWLTGRVEHGGPTLAVPGTDETETIPIDLSFRATDPSEVHLAIPTKISTRERISQAYVHQRMLDVLEPGGWRSVLCIANENNRMGPPRAAAAAKTVDASWLVDTTVAETIVQYERYTSHLSGLYYLDPPDAYINSGLKGLPRVRHFGDLLTGDLRQLLSRLGQP